MWYSTKSSWKAGFGVKGSRLKDAKKLQFFKVYLNLLYPGSNKALIERYLGVDYRDWIWVHILGNIESVSEYFLKYENSILILGKNVFMLRRYRLTYSGWSITVMTAAFCHTVQTKTQPVLYTEKKTQKGIWVFVVLLFQIFG
jgi:hypothetical protein